MCHRGSTLPCPLLQIFIIPSSRLFFPWPSDETHLCNQALTENNKKDTAPLLFFRYFMSFIWASWLLKTGPNCWLLRLPFPSRKQPSLSDEACTCLVAQESDSLSYPPWYLPYSLGLPSPRSTASGILPPLPLYDRHRLISSGFRSSLRLTRLVPPKREKLLTALVSIN